MTDFNDYFLGRFTSRNPFPRGEFPFGSSGMPQSLPTPYLPLYHTTYYPPHYYRERFSPRFSESFHHPAATTRPGTMKRSSSFSRLHFIDPDPWGMRQPYPVLNRSNTPTRPLTPSRNRY